MPRSEKFPALPLAAIFVLTLTVFVAGLSHGFVNWDDDYNFFKNPGFRLSFLQSFAWAWRPDSVGNFHPLSWHLIWLQAKLFGFSPHVFHFVSWALHAANASLLFLLLTRVLPGVSVVAAATGVLWFAVHPLRVEMVSWASCQPHLWSVFFALLATLAFTRKRKALTAVFFAAAVMCKAIVLTLPVLILFLPERRLKSLGTWRQDLFRPGELVLWGIAFVGGVVALYARDLTPAVALPQDSAELAVRLLNPLVVVGQAVAQSLWPANQSPLYPLLRNRETYLVSAFAAAVVLFWWSESKRSPVLRFTLWAFVVLLVPQALSAATEKLSFADRYTYLAAMPLAISVAWGAQLFLNWAPRLKWLGGVAAACLLVFLSAETQRQIKKWGDSEVLWRSALAATATPGPKALYNIAAALMEKGRFTEAENFLLRSLTIDRRNAEALNSLGVCAMVKGRHETAQHFLRDALKVKPNLADAMSNLAHSESLTGDLADAIRWIDHAVAISPGNVQFRENRARILHKLGRREESVREWKWLVSRMPQDPVPQQQLVTVLKELEGQ